jgi:hypothetical protein
MSDNDSNERSDEAFKDVLGVLDSFADELDSRRYPGTAWTPPYRVVSYQIGWKLVAPIAGIAALIAVALTYVRVPSKPSTVVTGGWKMVAGTTAPTPKNSIAQSILPRIVIVEDMDSYSIIDMTGDVPLVSFARRDSDGFDDPTPVFIEPVSEPTTKNAPL